MKRKTILGTIAGLVVAAAITAYALPGILNPSISFIWNAVPGASGFKLYSGTSSGVYGTPVDVGNTTSTVISGLNRSQQYYFNLTAYDTNGVEGPFAGEIPYKWNPLPGQPTGFVVNTNATSK